MCKKKLKKTFFLKFLHRFSVNFHFYNKLIYSVVLFKNTLINNKKITFLS